MGQAPIALQLAIARVPDPGKHPRLASKRAKLVHERCQTFPL